MLSFTNSDVGINGENGIFMSTNNTRTLVKCLCAMTIFAFATGSNVVWAGQQDWVQLAVHNFGAPINTMWDEGELTFADDGTMVYCSAREDLDAAPGDPKDLYIATFNQETGSWNEPVNMGEPVNAPPATDVDPLRKGDDREPWITGNGQTIYFKSDRTATTTPRNNNDLFVTHLVNGVWSAPELLPAPISTDAGNEHCPMLLQDGQSLCFASARPGGYGQSDIWCAQQDASGTWEDPVNQGPNINTAGNEFHFTQDTDGVVYFTSNRPGGFGGTDLYSSKQLGQNSWTPAINLGPQVNTESADMCPALPPGGGTLTWFSNQSDSSFGAFDIFWTNKTNLTSTP